MTTKQKQCLLCYLGTLAPEDIDGLWGSISAAATEKAQNILGIPADGVWGPQTETAVLEAVYTYDMDAPVETDTDVGSTGTFWDQIEFFDREEFRCQCGGKYCNGFPVEPHESMVRTVDEIRRRLGVPVEIVTAGGSGVRCPVHNANVGGVPNSEHLFGRAADLHSTASSAKMKAVAEEVMGNSGGIGQYIWGIHVDTGKYSRWSS